MKIVENKKQFTIKQVDYKTVKDCCIKYHYSKSAPQGKYKFGVFVDDELIGVVLFGKGANNMLAKCFNCNWNEIYELTRVALGSHQGIFTSAIISKCIKHIKKQEPQVKYIVSYADTEQGHKGTLYKACSFRLDGLRKISGNDYWDKQENKLIKGRSFWAKAKAKGLTEREYLEQNKERYLIKKKSNKYRYVKEL